MHMYVQTDVFFCCMCMCMCTSMCCIPLYMLDIFTALYVLSLHLTINCKDMAPSSKPGVLPTDNHYHHHPLH